MGEIRLLEKNDHLRSLDYCPDCHLAFEIVAADLSVISGSILLFACPGCGLTKAETRTEVRHKLRARFTELGRLLSSLKTKRERL
jgi:hypothetical protein